MIFPVNIHCLNLDVIVRTIWLRPAPRIVAHGAHANVRRHRRGEEPKQQRATPAPTYPLAMADDPDGREAPWIPAGSPPPCYPEQFSCRYGLRLPPSHLTIPVILTCSISAAPAPCRCRARAGCCTCEPRRPRVVAPGRVRNPRDRSSRPPETVNISRRIRGRRRLAMLRIA